MSKAHFGDTSYADELIDEKESQYDEGVGIE